MRALSTSMLRSHWIGAWCLVLASVLVAPISVRAQTAGEEGTLKAAALAIRHGVISPKYNLPKAQAEWPMGFMQLTSVGMRQVYDQGRALRRKYVDELGLIGESYDGSELFVRASNTDRALQTAQVLLLGLYPLGTGPKPSVYDASLEAAPSDALAFAAIPIHSVALEEDALMRPWTGQANCGLYRNYLKSLPSTDVYREQAIRYADFLRRIAAATGAGEGAAPAKILHEINEIYEPLSAMAAHNMALPEGISEVDMQLLSDLSDWNYHHQFLGKGVGRVTGGTFVGEIIRNFHDVITGGPRARKLYLYSGHQRTLLGIEAALGIETTRTEGPLFRNRIAPLASYYAFELRETAPGDYGVGIKFVSASGERAIDVPECGSGLCPFGRFVDLMSKVVPSDWRRECAG